MTDFDKNNELEEEFVNIIPLIDEETGEEFQFEIIDEATIDGQLYYALVPVDEEVDECIILKVFEDGDDTRFETVDDDDEFDKVADYFNDRFFEEVDYDEN